MKRLIVTSILMAAGLFAQAAGPQSGSAQTPQTSAPKTTVKKHRRAKKTVKPASSQPKAAVKAPVAKQ